MESEKFEEKRDRGCCTSCCCLLFTLVIGFLGVAAAVLFGVFYYRLFIEGNFVSIRSRIADLQMQLNRSESDVSVLQNRATSIPGDLSAQVQVLDDQLNQTVNEMAQISASQVQVVDAEFMQTLSLIQSVEDRAMELINQYSGSSAADFASASTSAISDYTASSMSNVDSTVSLLNNVSVNIVKNVNAVPTNNANVRTTYTRWGNSSCPDVNGTTLVYSGLVGGTVYWSRGGASNSLCLPTDPELDVLPTQSGSQSLPRMFGSEYESAFLGTQNENIPCAVCSVSGRSEVITIPAKVNCSTTWTREYYGYLMAERTNAYRTTYTCVDVGMESVPGSSGHADGFDLWLVEPRCGGSLPCPPYEEEKELACVVCSK